MDECGKIVTRIVAILLIAIASGCEPKPEVPPAPLQTPDSFAALLVNIRLATASGAILKDDFYTEDNLRHVYGAGHVTFSTPSCPINVIPYLRDFPPWLPRIGSGAQPYDAFDLRIRKYVRRDDKPGAWIALEFHSEAGPRPDFDDIERLFGHEWTPCPPPPPNPHGPIYDAPTRAHGNECIAYAISKTAPDRTLFFRFAPNALLNAAVASAGEEDDPPWNSRDCAR
jgi:hypothetical protein